MKTVLMRFQIIFLSALLLGFGNAVNTVHFCCEDCRELGEDVFELLACHVHEEENDGCLVGTSLHAEASSEELTHELPVHFHEACDGCSMNRISINLDDVVKSRRLIPDQSICQVFTVPVDVHPMYPEHRLAGTSSFPAPPLPYGRSLLHQIGVLRH